MFVICCLFVPISISFQFAGEVLTVAGIDPETAMHAQTYLVLLLPAVLINSLGDSIDLFLISMGYNKSVCLL